LNASPSPYNSIQDKISEMDDEYKNVGIKGKNSGGGDGSGSSSSDDKSSPYDDESEAKSSLSNDIKKANLTPRSTPNMKG
jgi:hypothetical protein